MILNLHSLAFNTETASGGGNPSWGTEMGQGEGYRFHFEDSDEFITALVYTSVRNPQERISCPLGKGGGQAADYEFVLGSLFDKVFVNGLKVKGEFILLVVKKLVGENHVGRRTLKYSPRMTLDGKSYNEACYKEMAKVLGVSDNGSWFVNEINVRNQDELHFTAYILDADNKAVFADSADRSKKLQAKLQAYAQETDNTSLRTLRRMADEVERAVIEADDSIKSQLDYLCAMRTKPFLLLAGISGTGKSRLVKQMAFESCPDNAMLRKDPTSPGNYCLIEVKPNWHDSTELLGYESQIGRPHYQLTSFVRFLAKAMLFPDTPFFVCLDEMNLAPVEQYFAEFLSVLESRTKIGDHIVSEPLIKADIFCKYDMEKALFSHEEAARGGYGEVSLIDEAAPGYGKEHEVYSKLKVEGLRIPENVIVVGTVNMDETTHQFSRKVIDRAMTIEMNLPEGDPFRDFFENGTELAYRATPVSPSLYLATEVKASDVIAALAEADAQKTEVWLKGEVASFLGQLNECLSNTPFKVAYRVQNELMLYFYQMWLEDKNARWRNILNTACDQILMMKVLPRIEGDEELLEKPLERLINFCEPFFPNATKKLFEMKERLELSRFTSFWP